MRSGGDNCRSGSSTFWWTSFRTQTSRNWSCYICYQRNNVVVGDNDQAIYRFRGASFGSFKLFLQRFAGWKEGEDSTPYRVALMENYRSTPNILRVASQAIGMNEVSPEFPKKVLQPNKTEGEKIRIVEME